MDKPSVIYAGYGTSYLDITSLSYRWFGAIWYYQNGVRVICGYWFHDSKDEIVEQIINTTSNYQLDHSSIKEIYIFIRQEQKRLDWERRSRLPFFMRFRKPWRGSPSGWYILFSREQFPLVTTCIRKTNISIWIEHISVCEAKQDVDVFISKINEFHQIQLPNVKFPVAKTQFHCIQ